MHAGRSRWHLSAILPEGTAGQQSAQTEQEKPRLTETNAPENLPSFIARILGKRLLGGVVQKIDELAVVGLLKIVKRTAEQEMEI